MEQTLKQIQKEVNKEQPLEAYRYVLENINDIVLQNKWLKQEGADFFGSEKVKGMIEENKVQLARLESKRKFFEKEIG